MKRACITIPVCLAILILILTACAAIGTKTVYKAKSLASVKLNKIGYSQIASEDLLNRIRPNTSALYEAALKKYFSDKHSELESHRLPKLNSVKNPDTSEIRRLCYENVLDAFICTQITYKFVNYSYTFIPLGKSEDVFVEIKIFDRDGVLAIHTKHNTSEGNSYMTFPKAEQTIEDATFGALKRVFKEIERSQDR